jgi:hypothetical protein
LDPLLCAVDVSDDALAMLALAGQSDPLVGRDLVEVAGVRPRLARSARTHCRRSRRGSAEELRVGSQQG